MLYKNFKIKNFKGIDKVEINLENNRIITLVGLNESGKTTIMEAIALFYRMIKGNDPETSELNEFRPKGIDFTGDIEIEATLSLEEDDKKQIQEHWKKKRKRTHLDIPNEFSYTHKFTFKLHTYQETSRTCDFGIKIKTAQKSLYQTDRNIWQEIIEFVKKEIVPEILYFDDFIFQIPNKICFVKQGVAEDEEITNKDNKVWKSVIDDILKVVNSQMGFQEHVVDIWETDEDAASNRLAQMEKVLDEKITSRWSELFGEHKVNFKEIKLEPKYSGGRFYLTFKIRTQSKREFLVNERSKGFKWFFSFLLFTEFRKKRTKNILFLLDEPASNLHSSAQTKILEALGELSKDALVIFSTHSHHLIKIDWLSGAYICINEDLSEETLAGNLNLSEGAKISAIKYFTYVGTGLGNDKISYFQPILDKLDYKPSTVEPIPNIVILEGKNDWYTIKYFSEVILKDQNVLNFYSGAGKDKLWDIIRLYLSWGKEFLVIMDGDAPSIRSKEKYEKEFNEFLKERIFTLKDILDISTATEGLIKEFDQKEIHDSVYGIGSFDEIKSNGKKAKENLNYAINQLLVQKKSVKISKETRNNFKRLLKFIKDKSLKK
ncbi:recombination protein F [archaeon BMS3Abin17]|nr:recombination protein F [archaeon BMS3Abin17]HDZ60726.1 hypothetical protein [Candidatus Pacearchaeota archaeon]